ncbi:MAG: hypothetical protein NTW62_01545 [Candidatus Nomurabacteria bacterium]|nr:hypothetical protein [Candidatus Nomurabacteria bacterium]
MEKTTIEYLGGMNKVFNPQFEDIGLEATWHEKDINFMKNNFGLYFLFLEIKKKYHRVLSGFGTPVGCLTFEEYVAFFCSEEEIKIFSEMEKIIKFKNYELAGSTNPRNIFCKYDFSAQLELDKLNLYQELGLDGFFKKYGFGQYLPLFRNPKSNECTVFIMHNDPNFSGMIAGFDWRSGIFDVLSILKNYPKDNPFTENIIFIKDDIYHKHGNENERSANNLISFILEKYVVKYVTFKIGGCSHQWSECNCSEPASSPGGTIYTKIREKYPTLRAVSYPKHIYRQ